MSAISWSTVGVAWALSVTSSIVAYIIVTVVIRTLRRRRRTRTGNMQRAFVTQVDANNKKSSPVINELEPSLSKAAATANNRRLNDDVSRWCTAHSLPEALVLALRQNGFTSSRQLDGLRPDDVTRLELPNVALAVQLRDVIESRTQHSSPLTSPAVTSLCGSSRSRMTSSTTDPHSPSQPLLTSPPALTDTPGSRPRDTSTRSRDTDSSNDVIFHGMLSDSGLHRLSGRLGNEWQHLATELGLSHTSIQRLIRAHPGALEEAIYCMLQRWRQGASGTKHEVKGQLYEALRVAGRNDLAEELHREQIKGSSEKMNKLISLY